MNPKDLRVGNYVRLMNAICYGREKILGHNIFTVCGVDSKHIEIDSGIGRAAIFTEGVFDFLEPISINNDILTDLFGFEHKIKYRNKNRTSDYFLRDDCSKMVQKYRQKYYLQNVTKFDPEALEIKYVHELQNLYFDKTGYELKPKEKQ